jgi:DNA-binding response OmpR family regulator
MRRIQPEKWSSFPRHVYCWEHPVVESTPANILVVDDDRLTGWAIGKGLAEQQLPFRVVTTGTEAREAFRSNRFDLVFLDLNLPDADGIELLGEIREISPGTRVVIVTGDVTDENREAARKAGADRFVEKPFDLALIRFLASTLLREARRTP